MYILIIAIMMNSGISSVIIETPYKSQSRCNSAGQSMYDSKKGNLSLHLGWTCVPAGTR